MQNLHGNLKSKWVQLALYFVTNQITLQFQLEVFAQFQKEINSTSRADTKTVQLQIIFDILKTTDIFSGYP